MKNSRFAFINTLVLLMCSGSFLYGKGAGTSGGLTLLESKGARASALGEAFTAAQNDISAFGYNPASLKSLKSGHASFLYDQGLVDDSFGELMIGSPFKRSAVGLSIGYYSGGDIALFDGVTERTVNAQRDLVVSLGVARAIGSVSLGVTGKYLSSELIETERARAFAADVGMNVLMGSRFNLGVALQNFGTQLKFIDEGDSLPRIARMGASYALFANRLPTTLLLDAPYYLNEQEMRPAVGVETKIGPLAVRAGYKSASDAQEFSMGAGFLLGRSSFDYAFGFANELDSEHRISLSMRFGGDPGPPAFVKKKKEENQARRRKGVREMKATAPAKRRFTLGNKPGDRYGMGKKARRVYKVKPGDTLSRIARKFYGDKRQWTRIYSANRHLIDSPEAIEIGQKIILP